MQALVQDLRLALRQVRRKPGFAAGIVVVMALGIGASAAMFSVLRATLLQPLPYRAASQLVKVQAINVKGKPVEANLLDVEEWRKRSHTLAKIAYFGGGTAYLQTPGGDQLVDRPAVSANLFDTLGSAPRIGRSFSADEQRPGHASVVLSDAVWRSQFAADAEVLGRRVMLDGTPFTVIGVMPAGFAFPTGATHPQVWTAMEIAAKGQNRTYEQGTAQVIARLQPGASVAEAGRELSSIEHSLRSLYTGEIAELLAPQSLEVKSYRTSLQADARPALLAVSAAVAVLWLIACASAAALTLARGMARRHETAVRGALGASRLRIVQQCVVESLLLGFSGAATGVLLAHVLLRLSARVLLRQLTLTIPVWPNASVLVALCGLTLLSALLFGGIPAIFATGNRLESALREDGSRSGGSRAQVSLQRALVVAELALTLTLVASCGLLLRTVLSLRRVPLGFRTDHVLVIEPKLPAYRYKGQDLPRTVYGPLLERVRRIPGVQTASLSTVMPLSGSFDTTMSLYLTRDGAKAPTLIVAKMRASSPELQQVLGFRMAQGRFFNARDTATSQPVAVVNRAFAMLYEPSKGDIVNHFHVGMGKDRNFNVVGVMDDFHQAGVAEAAAPEIDFNSSQVRPSDGFYQATLEAHVELALRTAREPETVIADVQRAMRDVDPALASGSIRTMTEIVDDAIGSQMLAARLLEGFAGVALIVALTGLYSLLSYVVTSRTRELGVRLALGARRVDIHLLVLRGSGHAAVDRSRVWHRGQLPFGQALALVSLRCA